MAPGLTLASLVIALKHTDTKPPCTGCFVTDLCVFQRPAGRLILVQATMQRTSMAPISRTVGSTQREKNAAFKHRALASNLAHERFLIVLKNWHAYYVNPLVTLTRNRNEAYYCNNKNLKAEARSGSHVRNRH